MAGSLARMHTQIQKLKGNDDILKEYHQIIQDQLENEIIEAAPDTPTGERVFYMPHRAVIREDAETTKLRIAFDASAKQCNKDVSLNDCLHTGPSLQPHLQDVLVRNRLKPIALLGGIKQAFLQIGIQDCDRDSLLFFWVKDLASLEVVKLRFTRLPFGCASSPFLLGGTLKEHLNLFITKDLENKSIVEEILSDLCRRFNIWWQYRICSSEY